MLQNLKTSNIDKHTEEFQRTLNPYIRSHIHAYKRQTLASYITQNKKKLGTSELMLKSNLQDNKANENITTRHSGVACGPGEEPYLQASEKQFLAAVTFFRNGDSKVQTKTRISFCKFRVLKLFIPFCAS